MPEQIKAQPNTSEGNTMELSTFPSASATVGLLPPVSQRHPFKRLEGLSLPGPVGLSLKAWKQLFLQHLPQIFLVSKT